jgi:hypothetical protein
MKPVSPTADIAAPTLNLTGSVENRVGDAGTFLPIVEQNTPQIFAQFEKIKFT